MGFLNPVYFSLGIFLAAVILFYMFRKQYKQRTVPSNMLWEQVMNEWQASPWLDRLQRNLLLFLQLLILILLMLALTKPYWSVDGVEGDHVIIILDTSASMAAQSGEQNRFSESKSKIQELLARLDGHKVTFITAGTKPDIVLKQETELQTVKKALDRTEISYEYSNLDKAVRLAASMAGKEGSSLHIFSDHAATDNIGEIPDTLPVYVHNAGKDEENMSIASFGVAKQDSGAIGVSVLENQTDKKQQLEFQIWSENEKLYESSVSLEAGSQKVINAHSLPVKNYYKAVIKTKDAYKPDNEMVAALPDSQPRIYAVGETSPFMVKGLETAGAEVVQLSAKEAEGKVADGIVLIQNQAPEDWPGRPVLAVNPYPTRKAQLGQATEATGDPLLRYVDFEKAFVQSAGGKSIKGMEPIAKSGEVPLILKGNYNGYPAVAVNFAIEDSDWPLHPGFPIFLYHAYEWLSTQESFLGFFQPGERKWLSEAKENEQWKIYGEDGSFIETFRADGSSFAAPASPGLYQAAAGKRKAFFAVNLDEREKNIKTEPSFTMNTAEEGKKNARTLRPYENLWFWLALCALAIMALEWEVYRRGI